MVLPRVNAIALLTGFILLVSAVKEAVPQACASMATLGTGTIVVNGISGWNWTTTGALQLRQNSNGAISGQMAGYVSSSCSGNDEFYNAAGDINSSGGFALSLTYTGGDSGCAPIINISGTVTGPGCATANGSWSNDRGLSGALTMVELGCQIPTGETNQVFQGWEQQTKNGSTYEAAVFNVQAAPVPPTFSWGGRTISETFPQPANDGCWFLGSLVPEIVHIATASVTLGNSGTYQDSIGPQTAPISAVTYYRQHGRTPCTITTVQVMVIDCPNPPANPTYATITQVDSIGSLQLEVTRGNYPPVPALTFGSPAPALTLTAWLFNLLFPPH